MRRVREKFRFKEFEVSHSASALPVGMDGVLIGAWSGVQGCRRILDAGCGCGLIALMCAQRCPTAQVYAVDIHAPSVAEASTNFAASPWADRMHASCCDFAKYTTEAATAGEQYDLIVSNPPFFNAGVDTSDTSARLTARHAGEFGPEALLRLGVPLLSEHGRICLICPFSQESSIIQICDELHLHIYRLCRVSGKEGGIPKRILIEAGLRERPCSISELAIRSTNNAYTSEYKRLTAPFYLAF